MENVNAINEEVNIEEPVVEEPVANEEVMIEESVANKEIFSEVPNTVRGVITNCLNLNIREMPSKDSDIVCELPALSEVQVDVDDITDEFYKIYSDNEITGYCMKKYVSI